MNDEDFKYNVTLDCSKCNLNFDKDELVEIGEYDGYCPECGEKLTERD